MKATMSMNLDTTWGNRVELSVESELDNAHELSTAEICRMQVWTLSLMVAEVRRQNEQGIAVAHSADAQDTGPAARERARFEEMSRSGDPREDENERLARQGERRDVH